MSEADEQRAVRLAAHPAQEPDEGEEPGEGRRKRGFTIVEG
jgi:hypothetical protein